MSDSKVLSGNIPGTDIKVQIFNPGYGFKINRQDLNTISDVAEMVYEGATYVHVPSPVNAGAQIGTMHTLEPAIDSQGAGGKTILHAYSRLDGVLLDQKEAYAVTSADCPTIVVHGRDKEQKLHVVAAHAGRDSLLRRDVLEKGTGSLWVTHVNMLIANAIHSLRLCDVGTGDIHVNVYCGIRTGFYHPPDNPQHGTYNYNLIRTCQSYGSQYDIVRSLDTGEVDLYRLIKAQAVYRGVAPTNIVFDDIDTGDLSQGWASRRRPGSWEDGERNLVIISRPIQ